jgi:uncharacterized LabA/DUF88 family protein
MSDRVAVFIDGGYLDKIQENLGIYIDYKKFIDGIVNDLPFLRAYYYHCPPYQSNPPTAQESRMYAKKSKFFDSLRRIDHVEVRLGRLAKKGTTFIQKAADILLAVDLVALSLQARIGSAFLVAGDSDFVPAVQTAKNAGVSVQLLYGGLQDSIRPELWDICDKRVCMDMDFFKPCIRP